jgi:type VI secretion system secreted protein Hcp
MPGSLFLKIPGCEGEATDDGHQKEIDVIDYRLAMKHPVNFRGTGMSGGEATVDDVIVTKAVDKASPNLMKFCLTGKHLDEVVLTARKRGENPIDYIKITLKNCMISSVDHSHQGDDHREIVTLAFESIKKEYTPQGSDGKPQGAVTVEHDVKKNK